MPAEKKITVFKAVNEEFQSKSTGEHVKKSFLEVVGEVVCTTIGKAADVAIAAVEKAGDVLIEGINKVGNFMSGGGCFITTAICEMNGKPDNCYELNQFRFFRDSWLKNQPDGIELIHKYYNIAPTIVKNINQESNSDEIYKEIEKTYLKPCLELIETQKYNECKKTYSNMVENLKTDYISWD